MEFRRTSSGKVCKKCSKKGSPCHLHSKTSPFNVHDLDEISPPKLGTLISTKNLTSEQLIGLMKDIIFKYNNAEKYIEEILKNKYVDPEDLSRLFSALDITKNVAKLIMDKGVKPESDDIKYSIRRGNSDLVKLYFVSGFEVEMDEEDWEEILEEGNVKMATLLTKYNVNMSAIEEDDIETKIRSLNDQLSAAKILLKGKRSS